MYIKQNYILKVSIYQMQSTECGQIIYNKKFSDAITACHFKGISK